MRPVQPPPPPKRESTTSSPPIAVTEDLPPTPSSRPPAPPPPARRRESSNPNTQVNDDATSTSESNVTVNSPTVPRKPPRATEIRTIPVEQALQSVLEHRKNLEDPILRDSHLNESKSTNPFDSHSPPSSPTAGELSSLNPSNSEKRASAFKPNNTVVAPRITTPPTPNDTENPAYLNEIDSSTKGFVPQPYGTLMPGEPGSLIYHKNTFSQTWFLVFLIIHTVQFIMMLSAANEQLSSGAFSVIVLLVVAVIILVLLSRWYTRKSRLSSAKNVKMRNGVCTPDDEADDIDDRAIYCLIVACVLEGIAYAIFAATVAGRSSELNKSGFYTQDTILQILRFASITLLALHRIIRPANRIDPMRTILELEVVAVCWDAIDGSTVYELLDGSPIDARIADAARVLMAIWYLSVGLRMALMFVTHLKPTTKVYPLVVTYPFQLAQQPTVDRTLQALRLRAVIIMTMACADVYAAILRVILWAKGQLNTLQQEMVLKNFLFLIACSGAYDMYTCTTTRNWNTRLVDFIFFEVRYPKRESQLIWLRWLFVIAYMTISICLTIIVINTAVDSTKWVANLVFDIILCLIFIIYCRNIHTKSETNDPKWFFIPKDRFFSFPFSLAAWLGAFMAFSLLGARIPGIYYNYSDMASSGVIWTYSNALLCISLSVIPIAFYNLYWSTGYMLFRKEFTAVPGNYNAIHDPAIQMMATSTMTEGALDVLSCATLMELAENNLPASVNGAIVLFCILEIFNACQSFALQVTLSGGHDDTPLDLVRWN
eukprot:gene16140-18251_t